MKWLIVVLLVYAESSTPGIGAQPQIWKLPKSFPSMLDEGLTPEHSRSPGHSWQQAQNPQELRNGTATASLQLGTCRKNKWHVHGSGCSLPLPKHVVVAFKCSELLFLAFSFSSPENHRFSEPAQEKENKAKQKLRVFSSHGQLKNSWKTKFQSYWTSALEGSFPQLRGWASEIAHESQTPTFSFTLSPKNNCSSPFSVLCPRLLKHRVGIWEPYLKQIVLIKIVIFSPKRCKLLKSCQEGDTLMESNEQL